MKRKLLLSTIVAIATMFCGFTANAEDYPLQVAGVQVTTENAANITGENIKAGKVSYDAATSTLTLDNAEVNGPISVDLGTSTILIKGNVNLTEINYNGWTVSKSTIKGMPGSVLSMIGNRNNITCFGAMTNAQLIFENIVGFFKSELTIEGGSGTVALLFRNSNITLVPTSAPRRCGAMYDIEKITCEGCSLLYPQGAAIQNKELQLNGQLVDGEVFIGTISAEDFVPVMTHEGFMSENMLDNTNTSSIKKGKISYDKQKNTLLLDNVEFKENKRGIVSFQENLKMEVNGKASVPNLLFNKTGSIEGLPESFLTLTDTLNYSICIPERNSVVLHKLNGEFYRNIIGDFLRHGTCTFDSCNLQIATKAKVNAILDLEKIRLKNDVIAFPEYACFSDHCIHVLGDWAMKQYDGRIEIRVPKKYDLKIGNVEVDEKNQLQVIVDGINGDIEYYDENKRLIARTLKVDETKVPVTVESSIPNLNIQFLGRTETSRMVLHKSTRLMVEDTLYIDLKSNAPGIQFSDTLKIYGNREKGESLIRGEGAVEGDGNARLVFVGCNLRLDGKGKPTISGLSEMKLEACEIVSPAGAAFDSKLGGVALNGKLVTSEIVIKGRKPRVCGTNLGLGNYIEEGKCDDIESDILLSGKASFDFDTNTLTLDNAKMLENCGLIFFDYFVGGDTIKNINVLIKGDVEMTFLQMQKVGTLLVEGTPGSTFKLYGESDSHIATLDNARNFGELKNLNGIIESYNAECINSYFAKITNCNLELHTSGFPILCGSNSCTFEGCAITEPLGAVFKEQRLWMDGKPYKGNVVISTDAAGVESVVAEGDDDPNAPMFNVMGQRIERPYHGQLYIQNGKKKVWFDK